MQKRKYVTVMLQLTVSIWVVNLSFFVHHGWAEMSVEVKENITVLLQNRACERCNLSAANLNRMDLTGVNLREADLTSATFYLADLSGADFSGAILRNTEFGGADLAEANFTGADLRGAQMSGAYLEGALIDGNFVKLSNDPDDEAAAFGLGHYVPSDKNAKQVPQQHQVAISKRRDFDTVPPPLKKPLEQPDSSQSPAAQLGQTEGEDPKKAVPLKAVTIAAEPSGNLPAVEKVVAEQGAEKKDTDRTGLDEISPEEAAEPATSGTVSGGAITDSAEHQIGAEKQAAPVDKAEPKTTTANSSAANKQNDEINNAGQLSAPGGQLAASITRLDEKNGCYHCNLRGAILIDFSLKKADLEGADLTNAKLTGADLREANLKAAILINADLRNADLRNTDLYQADLTGADLTGAKLAGALLDDAILAEVTGVVPPLVSPAENGSNN